MRLCFDYGVDPYDLIYPCYTGLPMGSTHAADIPKGVIRFLVSNTALEQALELPTPGQMWIAWPGGGVKLTAWELFCGVAEWTRVLRELDLIAWLCTHGNVLDVEETAWTLLLPFAIDSLQ